MCVCLQILFGDCCSEQNCKISILVTVKNLAMLLVLLYTSLQMRAVSVVLTVAVGRECPAAVWSEACVIGRKGEEQKEERLDKGLE